MSRSVVIAGAGNILAADDGVGVRAARELVGSPDLPAGARVLEVGTMGPDALALWDEGEAVVVLDAVRGGGAPGRVYRLDLEEWREEGAAPLSSHDLGIGELLREARLLGRPVRGVLLGVEPARLEPPGMELSPAVAAALPLLKEAALREARLLLGDDRLLAGPAKRPA